ncbi:sugar phosphate isomerase/epimerase family protein [Jiangella asiatica]|uniref:Xylose isomerase n=1 Tax=Jiangella asiatica TaxID=2530372 RepID=A0A4R5CIE4_9ACTN|nr:TIM barrel protein [Jiangella asiatica]TDD97122.1 xylose isomerase [Jiangella asiatica]
MTGGVVPGLVSVTFRQLGVAEVLGLVTRAGLGAVEWGGDVHVPAGDLAAARRAAVLSADAGIAIEAYGSYYRAGDDDPAGFDAVLRTAVALGAPRIRIWAGRSGSADAEPAARARVAADVHRIAALAAGDGVGIAVEHHPNTLTDTLETALELYGAADHPGVRPYWQPRIGQDAESSLREVAALLPGLVTAHVFSWAADGVRLPLADGGALWRPVLAALAGAPGDGARYALLEFVRDDDPAVFLEDAATLHRWLAEATPPAPPATAAWRR